MYANLPDKRYNTLVIDPPWPIPLAGRRKRRRHMRPDKLPYPVLTLEDIKAFPVGDMANDGAHVYCWTTNKMLRETFDVLDAWGVRFHLALVMVKKSGIAPCNGYVFGSEFCLLGFRGQPMQPFLSIGRLNWLVVNPVPGRHSAKPDSFYALVEEMSPGPRIDLFARKTRPKWDVWGDGIEGGFAEDISIRP